MAKASLAALTGAIEELCRTTSGAIALERAVATQLAEAVPFDAWCALTIDPASLLPTGGYHESGVALHLIPLLLEIEARGQDALTWPAMSRAGLRVDTLDRATDGKRERSQRFREVLTPGGIGHELRVTFTTSSGIWGALVLLRGTDVGDFTATEMRMIEESTAGVAGALRREMVLTDIATADRPAGPGLVLLDESLTVLDATAGAAAWLAEIDDGLDAAHRIPYAVTAVRSRVRTRTGRWLTLHAERLHADPRRISVIVEPARPVEIAELVADAYGLTARERDVVRLLSGGYTRREIARALALSAHTVDDHIKRVFAKLEVRSRAELTAKLYFDQHAPRIDADVPVGATGWFVH
ncbi:LuxR family transcriptional regulator [Nocardia huaxiensis]|uniref:LuxR family transcriptional regulator n=1 Tax=Nocardia huaxiensis TaxID=2755382 RepID=A0A7D6ZTS6_9NOCA|nr:LuxR C-terminal-related transcriptional regulator [Nocardia huaxiensis]QLY28469.1 LuxR family transcriptional regulator [Nocardia huaxiensis]